MKSHNIKKYLPVAVVFAVFYLAMLLQFWNTWMYYDDYGYYSLNYGSLIPHSGDHYSVGELLSYLGRHYSGANGRLFYFFWWLMVYKIGGLTAVRLAAPGLLTLLLFLIYKIASLNEPIIYRKVVYAAGVCLSFGLISQAIHQHGTYWHVAFYLYYPPVIMLAAFCLLWEKNEKSRSPYRTIGLSLLSFAVGWSVENLSAGFLVCLVILCVYKSIRAKKPALLELIYIVCCSLGTLILFMSPGLWGRANNREFSSDPITFVLDNTVRTLMSFWSHSNRIYLVAILLAALVISFKLYSLNRCPIDIVTATVISVTLLIELTDSLTTEYLASHGIQGLMLSFIILAAIITPVIRYSLIVKRTPGNIILITVLLSLLAMAMVPELQPRIFIPFIICSFIVIADMFMILSDVLLSKQATVKRLITAGIIIGIAGISVLHFGKTLAGYHHNYKVNVENDETLRLAASRIASGEEISVIELKKFDEAYEQYASCMCYQEDMEWFKSYINAYYGIPEYVNLLYK